MTAASAHTRGHLLFDISVGIRVSSRPFVVRIHQKHVWNGYQQPRMAIPLFPLPTGEGSSVRGTGASEVSDLAPTPNTDGYGRLRTPGDGHRQVKTVTNSHEHS
jgi:hypothetical protein